jgi:hypothetical protein
MILFIYLLYILQKIRKTTEMNQVQARNKMVLEAWIGEHEKT